MFRGLSLQQFGAMKSSLDDKLQVLASWPGCDLVQGWKLHSVGNCAVTNLESQVLATPRVKHGHVDCVFYDYSSSWVKTNRTSAAACQLLLNSVAGQCAIPLCRAESDGVVSAADAFADAHRAGLGGWWTVPGQEAAKDTVFWFSIPLQKESLPDWLQSNSLQSFITSFEALAQLLLLLGRLRGVAPLVHCMLVLRQLCDNSAVVACSRKGLCLKTPLCWILQAIGYYCSCHGVALGMHHCAGVRNIWADALSR